MGTVTMNCQEASSFKIVCDDRCAVVRRLASVVKWWDRTGTFVFVDRDSANVSDRQLVSDLDACPWSLLLIDEFDSRWEGPESIPIILKNLRFGRIAAVFYILPGTAWITRRLYLMVSRNRKIFRQRERAA
jgi:predicted DCC family thiol-disulfide oxidoreductase YuxK